MSVERSGPTVGNDSDEGKQGRMTNAPVSLRSLRRRIYIKAKAEPEWRFWGLYVHVCKLETLQEAYRMARENDGAPGSDGVTFAAIEESGVDGFLDEIRNELVEFRYRPLAVRKKEIPKDGGKKVRVLSIPAIRDRVVLTRAGPRFPGGVEAHPGGDLRSRFSTGFVRLSSEADGAGSGAPGGGSDQSGDRKSVGQG